MNRKSTKGGIALLKVTPPQTFVRPVKLREFQNMFAHIYNRVNEGYYSIDHLLSRFVVEVSRIMEASRKDRREQIKILLPRVFSWYNGVANRLEIDLQESLWYKYPGICTYCLREKDCSCTTEHDDIPNLQNILRRLRRDRVGREPILLTEHQAFHKKLYFRQNDRIMLIQTVSHIVEEAGEVVDEFYKKNDQGIRDEMADVGSWIFATANKLDLDLDKLIWERYPYECEKCYHDQCVCEQPV
ncbi:MAG: MazG nucleotide pyrophosphohydrolase domain-containing protein [Patescibacteria group bacterium]